jgi:secretion/DNA translocation related TadE-like protein
VWTVGGLALLMAVSSVVLWFGAAVVTRHRAASAADLAALAAAGAVVDGERRACGRARWVADQMSVVVRSCRLAGWDVLVEVVATPPGVLGDFGSAAARARAGPVSDGVDASSTVVHTR